MCTAAKKMGEKSSREFLNCNFDGDGCSERPGPRRAHCDRRVTHQQYTFTAIEREVEEGDLNCSNALVGTILRDPVAAARSTIVANSFQRSQIMQTLRTGKPPPPQGHPCLPPYDTYQHFDNFATRSLSSNYMAAPLEVTRHDLEVAKERLARMDVVLILEDLPRHLPQLEVIFGWKGVKMAEKANNHNAQRLRLSLSETEEALLRQANHLDYELYNFAKQVASERTAAAVAAR